MRSRKRDKETTMILNQVISIFENEILNTESSIKEAESKLSTLNRLKLALRFENESLTSSVKSDLKSWKNRSFGEYIFSRKVA